MDRVRTLQCRMREDQLVAQISYHEDRLRAIERASAVHRAAADHARSDLEALRQAPCPTRPHLRVVECRNAVEG